MQRSVRVVVSFVALAAVASGCGSSYNGLTKKEFLRQASASCGNARKASKERRDLRKQFASKSRPEERAKVYLDTALPLLDHELDRISDLKPPEADRERVEKIIEQARSDAKAFAVKLDRDPEQALSPDAQPFKTSSEAVQAYGFTICVS